MIECAPVRFDVELGSVPCHESCRSLRHERHQSSPCGDPSETSCSSSRLWESHVLGCSKIPVGDLPSLSAPQIYSYRDDIGMCAEQVKGHILEQLESCFRKHEEEPHRKHQKIVVTSPKVMDVTVTQRYVCQIHSQRDINVCALEDGYLQGISVREGQAVKKGDLMFKIVPVLYQPRLDARVGRGPVGGTGIQQHPEVVQG